MFFHETPEEEAEYQRQLEEHRKKRAPVWEKDQKPEPPDPKQGSTASSRYQARKGYFKSKLEHHAQWVLHNCLVHPLLGLAKSRLTVDLHSVSSFWLNKVEDVEVPRPNVPEAHAGWWLFHNLVAHPLIGMLPIQATFDLHDWSAEKMKAPGWV